MSHQNSRDHAVRTMFDQIARRYDLLNRLISLRLDIRWRQQAIAAAVQTGNETVLDLGTGTGDLAFAAASRLSGGKVIGLDFSLAMLRIAEAKRAETARPSRVSFVLGSALAPPFKNERFDAIVTAFVLRNISNLDLFFANSYCALKPGGRLVTLDMFPPARGWFSALYSVYFHRWMPWLGGVLGGHRNAYDYLSESVRRFDTPERIADRIRQSRFDPVTVQKFLRGAVCMHIAEKPGPAGRSESVDV
ncbi:MAG TPA: ubiquinone/menaquinone biosynthesis methyltransferase [Candidatus Eisenbacteria bacterium]|nr:ubiquinone/menaquinone biosynthesis methyltransferase [Candidatus Eisenbacteria bacterium]